MTTPPPVDQRAGEDVYDLLRLDPVVPVAQGKSDLVDGGVAVGELEDRGRGRVGNQHTFWIKENLQIPRVVVGQSARHV